jgi:hypothetical protein
MDPLSPSEAPFSQALRAKLDADRASLTTLASCANWLALKVSSSHVSSRASAQSAAHRKARYVMDGLILCHVRQNSANGRRKRKNYARPPKLLLG